MKTEPTEALSIKRANIVDKYLPPIDEQRYYQRLEMHEELIDLINSHYPKIKQLEWVEVYGSIFNADTSFKYAYEIHVNDDYSTILFDSSGRKPKRFINLKEAKAEAQADFERRVKECLEL